MSLQLLQLMAAVDGGKPKPKIGEVFALDQFKGTAAAQTITDGINRTDGVPVLDIFCSATSTAVPQFYDTMRGMAKQLVSSTTAAEVTQAQGITAYLSDGLTLGTLASLNPSGAGVMKYSFKQADGFFQARLVAHVNGTADAVDLSALGVVGMAIVKRTDSTSNFFMWHRAGTAGKLNYLNTTAAEVADTSVSVSGTTLSLSSGLATGTYVVYAWAHDGNSDGLIRCDSVTGSGVVNTDIGGEAQFLFVYPLTATGTRCVMDDLRSFSGIGLQGNTEWLPIGTAAVESATSFFGKDVGRAGFASYSLGSTKYAYMAIPLPRQAPRVATDVFMPFAQNGAGVLSSGFNPDGILMAQRNIGSGMRLYAAWLSTKLWKSLAMPAPFDSATVGRRSRNGIFDTTGSSSAAYMYWLLRRAPGFYAQETYVGTSTTRAQPHSLGVTPELILVGPGDTTVFDESGNSAKAFAVRATPALVNNQTLFTSDVLAQRNNFDVWGGGAIGSATTFNLGGGDSASNAGGVQYVAHLFASLPGISKVGAYAGNNGSQTIDCGFAAGIRGLVIRDTAAGAWYFWDAARGITDSNDPHIQTTSAEVTTDDSIDPAPAGFIVNQLAATNINLSGHTYLYLAIA